MNRSDPPRTTVRPTLLDAPRPGETSAPRMLPRDAGSARSPVTRFGVVTVFAAVLVLGGGAFLARTIASKPAPERPVSVTRDASAPSTPSTPAPPIASPSAAVIESIAPTTPLPRLPDAVVVPAEPPAAPVARKTLPPTAPKPHARPQPRHDTDADVDLLAAMVDRLRAGDPAVRPDPPTTAGASRACAARDRSCAPAAADDSRAAAR